MNELLFTNQFCRYLDRALEPKNDKQVANLNFLLTNPELVHFFQKFMVHFERNEIIDQQSIALRSMRGV